MLRFVVLDGLAKPGTAGEPRARAAGDRLRGRERDDVGRVRRRDALRALLPAAGVDALLVTDLVNVRYLTGFTGSNAALLVHVDGDAASRFCTDGRYRDAGRRARCPTCEPVIDRACAARASRGRAAALGVGGWGSSPTT